MKHRSLNQLAFIAIYLRHWLTEAWIPVSRQPLPAKIGDYTLQRKLEKEGTIQDYQLGIYKNPYGEEAIGKLWSGTVKNPAYYMLRNECLVYDVLTRVLARVHQTIPPKLAYIQVPTCITHQETDHTLLLLTQRLEGKPSGTTDPKRWADIYLDCVDFLHYLGSQFTPEERQQLSVRTATGVVLLYPFLVVKACLSHPRLTGKILAAVPGFITSIPAILAQKESVLVHRDLHFNNMLVGEKTVAIIDFQLCVFSFGLSEWATSLKYIWHEQEHCRYLWDKIVARWDSEDQFQTLSRGMIIHAATHGLTGRNFTPKVIASWADYLQFSRRLSF